MLDDTAIKDLAVFLALLQARSDEEATREFERFYDAINVWLMFVLYREINRR